MTSKVSSVRSLATCETSTAGLLKEVESVERSGLWDLRRGECSADAQAR